MKGSCLCGSVVYEVSGSPSVFQYCHCQRCRKITGSAHAANLIVPSSQFRWLEGEQSVGRFEQPGAKYFAASFCKKCGSSMPWAVQGGGANVVVPAGTLDEEPNLVPQQNIFWGSRAPWYCEAGGMMKFEGLPLRKKPS